MSIEAINWALNIKLPPTQKLVAIALSNYANDERVCWPSFVTLAKKTCLSRRSIIQQIKHLEQVGAIKKVGTTPHQTNIFYLNFNFTGEPDSLPSERRSPAKEGGSEPHSLVLVNHVHPPSEPHSPVLVNDVHPIHHITIIEPSIEPSSFMSGNEDVPDDAHDLSGDLSKKNTRRENKKFLEEAKEIINFLNRKAGKNFQHVDGNLNFVIDRLKEGASMSDCKMVIAARCRKWNDDLKMREYLRPPTLFNKTKFASYIGELGNAGEGND